MVTVFVDYENVSGDYGLSGAEYLTKDDDLRIFYSKSCPTIRREDLSHIEESGCSLSLCELDTVRKNALDFYIATEAGIAYQSGAKYIILVTRDDGFQSIKDYFKVRNLDAVLIIACSIEKGLLNISGKERNKRKNLMKRNEKIMLSAESARINEQKALRKLIIECLSETEYANDIPRVLEYIDRVGTSSKKDLYRESLHEFGRASGTVIYNMVKKVV